ncbi:hypothetical protein CBR_g4376 [Chara braunii]|uniref:5'-nucleotidase n=1 Tax=Chara braunii TaxID=69332 RepID=A0A388KHM0_CHABU|nr:hypothetical protein CBR_g4376 [Chara braunii]|eukprot:GBG69541.1 hypothetical protein CBR_g4376 [Chara braunii]
MSLIISTHPGCVILFPVCCCERKSEPLTHSHRVSVRRNAVTSPLSLPLRGARTTTIVFLLTERKSPSPFSQRSMLSSLPQVPLPSSPLILSIGSLGSGSGLRPATTISSTSPHCRDSTRKNWRKSSLAGLTKHESSPLGEILIPSLHAAGSVQTDAERAVHTQRFLTDVSGQLSTGFLRKKGQDHTDATIEPLAGLAPSVSVCWRPAAADAAITKGGSCQWHNWFGQRSVVEDEPFDLCSSAIRECVALGSLRNDKKDRSDRTDWSLPSQQVKNLKTTSVRVKTDQAECSLSSTVFRDGKLTDPGETCHPQDLVCASYVGAPRQSSVATACFSPRPIPLPLSGVSRDVSARGILAVKGLALARRASRTGGPLLGGGVLLAQRFLHGVGGIARVTGHTGALPVFLTSPVGTLPKRGSSSAGIGLEAADSGGRRVCSVVSTCVGLCGGVNLHGGAADAFGSLKDRCVRGKSALNCAPFLSLSPFLHSSPRSLKHSVRESTAAWAALSPIARVSPVTFSPCFSPTTCSSAHSTRAFFTSLVSVSMARDNNHLVATGAKGGGGGGGGRGGRVGEGNALSDCHGITGDRQLSTGGPFSLLPRLETTAHGSGTVLSQKVDADFLESEGMDGNYVPTLSTQTSTSSLSSVPTDFVANQKVGALGEQQEVRGVEMVNGSEGVGVDFAAKHISPCTEGGVRGAEGSTGNLTSPRMGEGGAMRWQFLPTPDEPDPVPIAVPDDESPTWTSRVWASPVDMRRQIFCNRSLNMQSIEAVGFDMDYTLAQYRPDTFETLAYKETVSKLVRTLGYPNEILEWEFDWRYMVRGLSIDKKRGNVIKMDRHKYVKVAYHGFREMTRKERLATYDSILRRESFDEPDYAMIDTLFSLAEAYLFAQLVDYIDAYPARFPNGKKYADIYKDVREAVDLCHRDGSLKLAVASNPGKYIYNDPQIVPMLEMLRSSGRITFLVTNSLWDYTHVVMNYLCGKCGTEGGIPRDDDWLKYFDVVVTGSCKPAFFVEGNRARLFEVHTPTGFLSNTDNGSPMAQIGNVGLHALHIQPSSPTSAARTQGCRVFQGGSSSHLHSMLGIESGSQVLYVGDHIYGDILRSKKQVGWRTMLVVPELEKELQTFKSTVDMRKRFFELRQLRDALDDSLQRLKWALKFETYSEEENAKLTTEIEKLEKQRDEMREAHRQAQQALHHKFHSVWGQLMKTGYQNSRFAHQVERFACLYTSHVANLCYYSPNKSYRTVEDSMPHEASD